MSASASKREVVMPKLELDPTKVAAVRRYVERHFKALERNDFFDPDRYAQVFRVYDPQSRHDYTAVVARDFLDDNEPEKIERLLERWQVAETMRQTGRQREVFVTRYGARIEDRS